MSVALANALRKSWFAYTNNQKAHNPARHDRLERGATSLCQDVSVVDDSIKVLKTTSRGSKCFDAIANTMRNTKSTSKLLDWLQVGTKWAGKLVNPILCVAGAARAWAQDDKVSGAIQEACALGMMFFIEGKIKNAFGLEGKPVQYVNNKYVAKAVNAAKNFSKNNKWLGKLPQNKLGAIAKGVIFVIGSCSAFAAGEKIGKTITKYTTEPHYKKTHPEKCMKPENNPFNAIKLSYMA